MVDKFLSHFLISKVDSLAKQQVFKDDKSLFQEIAQAKKGITPHYVTLTESGPDHKKIFQVAVYLDSQLIAKGKGLSKQSAQEDASRKATKILTNQL
ncbi:MAG: Ribonuclease 3 [Candidatus Shapirobacteria bacterium GW2011_GWE2_38_30]|nr:MAG: Ribonuclease 3 [Candidatus Shapirobacteria bacterium GW2011_GWE2_38_30]